MIGPPENDFRHTGHVGLDGSHFGDVKKLVNKSELPRQIVAPSNCFLIKLWSALISCH